MRARYPHEKTERIAADIGMTLQQVYHKARSMGISKTPEYRASPDAQRLRRGDNVGAAYRFPKGHVPANKGAKGISYPGMEATQFKKGQKSFNWMPLGSERHSKGGYLQRKMTVEVEYAKVVGAELSSNFLPELGASGVTHPAPGVTRHRLK